MLNDKSYINIQAWMTKLDLNCHELMIYAIIYGFSQDGESWFNGSVKYICEWTNLSQPSVISNLNKLVDKKLLIKRERSGTSNLYQAVIPKDLDKPEKKQVKQEALTMAFDDYKPSLQNKDYKELSDDEKFELDKNKKDLRTLEYWTKDFIRNEELQNSLITWLRLMMANKKFQTLTTYRDKLQKLLDSTKDDNEAIRVVKDTIDKGYFSFQYSINGLKKLVSNNQNLYNPYKDN